MVGQFDTGQFATKITLVTPITLVALIILITLITLITLVTLVTLVILVLLVTLVTLFWSANQFYRAVCTTVSGFFFSSFRLMILNLIILC